MLMIGLGGDPNKIEYDGYYEDTYVRTPRAGASSSACITRCLGKGNAFRLPRRRTNVRRPGRDLAHSLSSDSTSSSTSSSPSATSIRADASAPGTLFVVRSASVAT